MQKSVKVKEGCFAIKNQGLHTVINRKKCATFTSSQFTISSYQNSVDAEIAKKFRTLACAELCAHSTKIQLSRLILPHSVNGMQPVALENIYRRFNIIRRCFGVGKRIEHTESFIS